MSDRILGEGIMLPRCWARASRLLPVSAGGQGRKGAVLHVAWHVEPASLSRVGLRGKCSTKVEGWLTHSASGHMSFGWERAMHINKGLISRQGAYYAAVVLRCPNFVERRQVVLQGVEPAIGLKSG